MLHPEDQEIGVYYDRTSADRAVGGLCDLGYDVGDISVLMSDTTRGKEFADTGRKTAQGAVAGAIIGGGLSAIVAGLTATGSIIATAATGGAAAPLVAGPLAAALAALGAGGGTGGIIGALVGMGISEEEAKKYHDALAQGGIIVSIRPRAQDRERVRQILATPSAQSRQPTAQPAQPMTRGTSSADISVVEEKRPAST
jgi:hypothetical protein